MKHLIKILFLSFISFSLFAQESPESTLRSRILTMKGKRLLSLPDSSITTIFDKITDLLTGRTPFLTIDELRAGIAGSARVVYINQGVKSGTFIFDPADTSTPDDGALTLVVTNTSRRYKRPVSNFVSINWFGAIPNDNVSDRQAVIDALAAAVPRNINVLVPIGAYHIGGKGINHISLQSNSHLLGEDTRGSKLIQIDSTNKALFVAINRTNISIENLTLEGGKQDFTTVSVQLDRLDGGVFRNLIVNNLKQAFYVYGTGSGASTVPSKNLVFDKIYFPKVYDFAIRLKDNTPENITITDCTVDSVLNNTAFGETSAFRIMGKNIQIIRPKVWFSYDTGIMVSGVNNDGILIDGAIVRSTQVSIFIGTGAKNVALTNSDLSSANDHGVHLYNPAANDITTGNRLTGNRIHDCAKTAIYIEGSSGNSVTLNYLYRNGKKTSVADRERTGVTLIPNTQLSNSSANVVASNVIFDDQATPTQLRGISVETNTIDNLIIENNVILNVSDANKIYFAAGVTERSIYSLRSKIDTPLKTITSRPLSVGEFTNANKPVASSFPGGNAVFWNRDTKGLEFTNGSEWVTILTPPSLAGLIPVSTNDTIPGQKTWTAVGNFSGNSPQVKLSQGTGNVELASSGAGNFVITPSGGTMQVNGSLVFGLNTSNVYIPNNMGLSGSITAGGYQFANSTSIQMRRGFRGTTTGVLTVGNSYAGTVFGGEPVTTAASGTHNYVTGVVIKAPIITDGGATVNRAVSLLIDDQPANGYGITNRVDSRFIGKVQAEGVFVITALPVYADNAAAIAGGLTAGTLYRTSAGGLRITY